MKSLHENVVFLQAFLQKFPVNDLEDRIKDVSGKVEDIIRSHTSSQKSADEVQFDAFGGCTEEFNSIVEEAKNRENQDLLPSNANSSTSSKRDPSGKEILVGFDEDLIQIKDRVVGQEPNLQIIPITGMGGIGKTTLARKVYKDQLITDYFDVRHWVTVSQEYRVHEILEGILSEEGSTQENVEFLIELVYRKLKGRRYLIVLDDMWHAEVWDQVRRAFPDDYNGSRVILTTRLSDVAVTIDSESPLHRMRLLDEDKSWTLLREQVFEKRPYPGHIEKIGKNIASNCKGLPLAIVVIAGVLKANKKKEYWEYVAENVVAASTANDEHFSRIFSLSYNNLSHHLKECFLYMGVFPEDHKIPVKKLFKLWIADGFLSPIRPKNRTLEEMAEEYLEDLVERSLVSVSERRSNKRIRYCTVHDLLRDLSLQKGREEMFLLHVTDMNIGQISFQEMAKTEQRLSIRTDNLNFLKTKIQKSPVHSLLYFCTPSNKLSPFTSRFESLRVADELRVDSVHFPDKIFELVDLRYLAFTYNKSDKCRIPPSIAKLQNLQTLIINRGGLPTDYMCEVILPLEIWKMPELRHLVLMRNTTLCFPYGEGLHGSYSVLENLQTLSNVMNFKFTMEAIRGFPNLKKLRFQYNSIEPKKWGMFCLNNLVHLQELEEFNFRFHAGSAHVNGNPLETNLAFPQKLKKLTLTRSGIPWEKMSMVGSLPNLEVLKLMKDSFVGREWEPIEGEFLVLKYLEMESLNLVEWQAESEHFPSLEKVYIRWCYGLKEVPSSIGDIPTLKMLFIQNCNVKAEQSVREIGEEQESLGNDVLQVKIAYPSEPPKPKPAQSNPDRNQNRNRNQNQNQNNRGTEVGMVRRMGRTGG